MFPNLEIDDLESATNHLALYGWRKKAEVPALGATYFWSEEEREIVALTVGPDGKLLVDGMQPAEFRKKWQVRSNWASVLFLVPFVVMLLAAIALLVFGPH